MSVLNCVYESVSQILRKNVERRALFDALDVVMLAIDEIVDGGIVLESDPNAVVNRVALRSDDIPLGEQTVAQVSFPCTNLKWVTVGVCFISKLNRLVAKRILYSFF